jgi:hypothetical protein
MTPQEAAAKMDGRQYRDEVTDELRAEMKAAGLVAVYGASDDLMEFDGAIHDEVGCYDGGTAYLTGAGILQNDCDNDECPHFLRQKEGAPVIEAKWDVDGFSWKYETAIPHAKFVIKEDGDNYCEGIVFALADVGSRS